MDDNPSNKEPGRTFKRPSIEQIKNHAKELKKSQPWGMHPSAPFTFTTSEGITFKTQVDPWDQPNIIQRALNLKNHGDTCWIESKNESLKNESKNEPLEDGPLMKILFRYYPDVGEGITLRVDGTNTIKLPANAKPRSTSKSGDGTTYKTFDDPDLKFTILR